jgi:hypothetical protein
MIKGLSGLKLILNINQANPANPMNHGSDINQANPANADHDLYD